MSVSAFNRRWAAVILEALTRHGRQTHLYRPWLAFYTVNVSGGGEFRIHSPHPFR
ncbi:2-succinyl-5-enolpyruvyl-6-hydroxy-3-cyclohexene-1-carboxylate synthase [Escherichia coli]|uniref:2-succinyl-5-enolpyruvyl-6-hydroxy-3-cyclohexene-1-carboxylate synthase n=1 Tax=Escherichia coli TaxID=562 RepID=A0A376U5U6_ECOLX|nr:2-succinyl-5-enolpyruvyl-6-hydroxy-3-cyclohexene-1-carboxylate synthase [Escherichia coli]